MERTAVRRRLTWHAATVTGAVSTIGWSWGVNITSWYGPLTPLSYFPVGVAGDFAIDLKEAVEAPWAQKPAAFGRVLEGYGRLSFPGELLFKDVTTSLEKSAGSGDPRAALAAMLFGRPTDKGIHMLLEQERPQGEPPTLPVTLPGAPAPIPQAGPGILPR